MQSLPKRFLDAAVADHLLTEGQAHRVALAVELAALPRSTPVSGESLGRLLGISRAGVHKQVRQLTALGFAIESVARTGYELVRPFSDLVVAEAALPFLLQPECGDDAAGADVCAGATGCAGPAVPPVGLPYRYVDRCASTNALLKEAVASGEAAVRTGTVLVTDEQTGGRGRLGRSWASRAGEDLTFSVLVRPALAPARAHLLSLAAALAVAETIEGWGELATRVGIKWPNDVMLGDGKVCGILLEGSMDADRLQWAIVGIGLNVNSDPASLIDGVSAAEREQWRGRPRPASLRGALGTNVPRAPLLARLLQSLGRRFTSLSGEASAAGADDILAGVRKRDTLLGRQVDVFSGASLDQLVVSGRAAGIGAEGQLLVATESGDVVPAFAGDVTLQAGPVNH